VPDEIDQATKRRVLANDQSVREQQQASTYFQHAVTEADEPRGRFQNASGTTTVIGRTPIPQYPELPANSPSHHDPVPDEPPLGFAINEMAPLEPSVVEVTDPASADAPSVFLPVPDVPRTDAGPFSNKEEDDDAA